MRRGFGEDVPQTLEDPCDPATTAVIVYDMQVGVLRQLPDGGAEAIQRVSQVLAAARDAGYPVFFTRHMSLPVRLMGTSQLRTAMRWQRVDDRSGPSRSRASRWRSESRRQSGMLSISG
jgi:biuret amidohydrolase